MEGDQKKHKNKNPKETIISIHFRLRNVYVKRIKDIQSTMMAAGDELSVKEINWL
jgi:hypothetical protein